MPAVPLGHRAILGSQTGMSRRRVGRPTASGSRIDACGLSLCLSCDAVAMAGFDDGCSKHGHYRVPYGTPQSGGGLGPGQVPGIVSGNVGMSARRDFPDVVLQSSADMAGKPDLLTAVRLVPGVV